MTLEKLATAKNKLRPERSTKKIQKIGRFDIVIPFFIFPSVPLAASCVGAQVLPRDPQAKRSCRSLGLRHGD